MRYQVFVSHSNADYNLAEAIQDAARTQDIRVYAYEQDLQPGSDLPEKLLGRIRESDALVVLLTEQGAASAAVNQEIGAAKSAGKPIVPIVDQGIDREQFTLLQGREFLLLDRQNPTQTVLELSGRLASLRRNSETNFWIFLLVLAGLVVWASRS